MIKIWETNHVSTNQNSSTSYHISPIAAMFVMTIAMMIYLALT